MPKITELAASTVLTADDLLVLVDAPGGSAAAKKITAANARNYFGGSELYQSHGNTGSTETIDLASGAVHRIVLDDNCTLTFTGAAADVAYSFTLIVVQDGGGGNTITWPASVDWPGAAAPTLSSGGGDVDVFTFLTTDGGTIWLGFTAGQDMS